MISGDYHVKYCVRNSLDKFKCIYVALLYNYQRLAMITGDYHVKYCVLKALFIRYKTLLYLSCFRPTVEKRFNDLAPFLTQT